MEGVYLVRPGWVRAMLVPFAVIMLLGVFAQFCRADQFDDRRRPVAGAARPAGSNQQSKGNALLTFIYGKAPKNGIVYLPFGMHTQSKSKDVSTNNLISITYNSLSAGTFINSFHERTWHFGVTRTIYSTHGFGIDYFAGVLYGYKGKLARVNHIPFRNSFLFKYNLTPGASLNVWFEPTNHLQLQILYTPLVILSGVKYNF
ncbi:MAG: hypothetical protein D6698_09240 [Gammaproteobacteria bacterium]|nr:MAG: hypothetical protein D6698_09240 [Gammaproteobacteria bacterium]